ncbi:spermatogenesis-associated protein 31E1-like [Cynocephalus volans]|uniref:spermatogenesis-associated protein 31E1-like n=1 Tax=Cynocephalus volans TaxID=110931 RepID=UPI002FC90FCB
MWAGQGDDVPGSWPICSWLQCAPPVSCSYLEELPDPLVKVHKPTPSKDHQPRGVHVEDAAPVTVSPLAATAPLAERPLSVASILSAEPQEDQPEWKRITPGTSGLDRTMSFLSLWQATAKALFFPTSSHGQSHQEHLSHHPAKALYQGDPTRREIEAGGPSFINPDVQKLLETLITKRAERKMWKEDEKVRSFVKQQSPESFWSLKDKPEQLPSPQVLSYPRISEDHLQQCSQFFWGLSSLHSESLMATAWVSRKPSSRPSSSVTVLFNRVSDFCPAQVQATVPPHLSQAKPLPRHVAQLQLLSQNWRSPLTQVQTQAHPPSSLPNPLRCSPPLTRTSRTSRPTSQKESPSFIRTSHQHLEWPSQKRLKQTRDLPSVFRQSQEGFSQHSPNLPQTHKLASILPGDSTSPYLQEPLQPQGTFIKDEHPYGLGQLTRPQGEFSPMTCQCQAKIKHGPSKHSGFVDESSQNAQKRESRSSGRFCRKGPGKFKLEKDPRKNPGQGQDSVLEDPSTDSGSTSVKVVEVNKESSESDSMRPQECDSGKDLLRAADKQHLQETLKVHLGRKLGEINEGTVPGSVCQSRLAASHAFPKSDTHTQPRNPASSKGEASCVDTSQDLSFLSLDTQKALDTHIRRILVENRWSPDLQAPEPINLKLNEVQPLSLQQSTSSSSTTREFGANSTAEVANFLGEPPQKYPGGKETAQTSVSTVNSPLPAPSPARKEAQRSVYQTEIQSGDKCGHSVAPLTGKNSRWPSQPLTCNVVGTTWHSANVLGAGRGSLELSPSPAMSSSEPEVESVSRDTGDTSHSAATQQSNVGAQCPRAEETRKAAAAAEEKPPAWGVTLGAGVMANTQTDNVIWRSSGSLGTGKSVPSSRIPTTQTPGEPRLTAQIAGEFERRVEAESEKGTHNCVTSVLLQDCATGVLHAPDIWSSQASLSGFKSTSSSDALASQGPRDVSWRGQSSQGQEEPRNPRFQNLLEKQSKRLSPIDRSEGRRRPTRGAREHRAAGLSQPAQDRESVESLRSQSSQLPPEKGQASPESQFRHRIRRFLQCLNLNKKGKGQEDPLQKGRPTSATAWSQGPDPTRSSVDSMAEAHAIITSIEQMLVDRLQLRYGHGPSEINWHEVNLQTPVGGHSCYPRAPSYPEQRIEMRDMACNRHATPAGHSHPVKNRQIRDRDSNWASPPRKHVSPASPCQHRTEVVTASGRPVHHPRHCLLRRGISSGHPDHASHPFPSGKTFPPVESQHMQRKSILTQVGMYSVY